MKGKRLTALTMGLALAVAGSTASMAAIFENGTPTVYIGYGAGGGTDTAVRPVVAEMANYLGESINCVNMEGANSAVACDYVLEQAHDGYSMFATGTGGFSFPIYNYSESSWQDWISFHPYSGPAVVFANKDSGVTTTEELFNYLAEGNSLVSVLTAMARTPSLKRSALPRAQRLPPTACSVPVRMRR